MCYVALEEKKKTKYLIKKKKKEKSKDRPENEDRTENGLCTNVTSCRSRVGLSRRSRVGVNYGTVF